MIISRKKKFIFVHNPRTAGRSISKVLNPWRDMRAASRSQHWTLSEIKDRVSLDTSGFFIFGFVRNPWSRFFSLFIYLQLLDVESGATVNELAARLGSDAWLDRLATVRPQVEYFDDTVHIGRYENLKKDFATILGHLRIGSTELPSLQGRPGEGIGTLDYRDYYDDRGRNIIARWYAGDIETYGYEFE